MTRRLCPTVDQRGSIPLALLAIISLSGIIAALVMTMIASANAVRFDQSYTEVIQAADAGAQMGVQHLLRSADAATLSDMAVGEALAGSGSLDGMSFTWSARKGDASTWTVTGTATSGEVTRTAVIEVAGRSRFQFAAFSDNAIVFRGSNLARSYDGSVVLGGDGGTGKGIVATNGDVTINGNSSDLDGVHLYNWEMYDDLGRCRHSGGGGCDDVLRMPSAELPSARILEPLDIGPGAEDLDTQFILDQRAAAECPAVLDDYVASTTSGVLGAHGERQVLCVANATFDVHVDVLGYVEMYVYGDLRVSNHVEVNCNNPTCPDQPWTTSGPESSRLRFYVAPTDDAGNATRVAIGNNARVAAGIYAPTSACGGNPSNAQALIYGSIICASISNQGGWDFHYDERLGDASVATWDASRWDEE